MSASNSQSQGDRERTASPGDEQSDAYGDIFSPGIHYEDRDPENDDDEDADYQPVVEEDDDAEFEGAHF